MSGLDGSVIPLGYGFRIGKCHLGSKIHKQE